MNSADGVEEAARFEVASEASVAGRSPCGEGVLGANSVTCLVADGRVPLGLVGLPSVEMLLRSSTMDCTSIVGLGFSGSK